MASVDIKGLKRRSEKIDGVNYKPWMQASVQLLSISRHWPSSCFD